eukprot:755520-Hanusia_phi.AAC.1
MRLSWPGVERSCDTQGCAEKKARPEATRPEDFIGGRGVGNELNPADLRRPCEEIQYLQAAQELRMPR